MKRSIPEQNQVAENSAEQAPAEWVDISRLVPWVGNPRKNDKAVKRVADSIKRFGFGAPVLARKENGEIIAGHTRVRAARRLGMRRVPVRYLDLNETDAHLLALADNKLNEIAEWDEGAVAELLSSVSIRDALEAGWDAEAISDMASALIERADDEVTDAAEQASGLKYQVVVECDSEEQQAELLERLEAEGLACRPLIS